MFVNPATVTKAPLTLPSGALLVFSKPLVMSIVNCNGDSFFPDSRCPSPEAAAERALKAREEGADIVDFGAESTRPFSAYISEEEELSRLVPAISLFRKRSGLPVSADTRRASVAKAALDAGADIINDISALADPDMAPLLAARKAPAVIMHMRGDPGTMQRLPETGQTYADIAGEVRAFLEDAVNRALDAGMLPDSIILDPGFGFGKTTEDNFALLNRLAEIRFGDYPVLVGLSRKSCVGSVTGRLVEDRLAGTLAVHAAALAAGADILRVHDTPETADLVAVFEALRKTAVAK